MKNNNDLEIYAPIKDFPNYLVTSRGRVFSLRHDKLKKKKQGKSENGYLYVKLYKNGKQYHKSVHRLVAQTFIPNHGNKTEVNHINEIKTDNRVENLEWMTHKENINHGTHNERVGKSNSDGRRKGYKHNRARAVIGFKINGCGIKYFKYMSECEKDGFDRSNICKCCKGEQKHHKNYMWYYADEYFKKGW